MADITLVERFPIHPDRVSVRLFFAKASELDNVWHLCDAALGTAVGADGVMYVALHGAYIYPAVRCDTVLQADIRRGLTDGMCARCLEEYQIAVDTIRERKLMRFE